MQVAEFKDFAGGITELDIASAPNRYAIADNVLIDTDKTIHSRGGLDIYSSTAYQLGTAERVARLTNFGDLELIGVHAKKVEYISAGAWAELTGPTTNKAFNTNTAASLISEAQWNNHLYYASDSGDPVIKIYRDSGAVIRLRTAGLPEFVSTTNPVDGGLADAKALVNDLLTKMTAHATSEGGDPAAVPNSSSTGHHGHREGTVDITSASTNADFSNTAIAVEVGDILTGTGVTANTTVTSITGVTGGKLRVVLSVLPSATATITGSLFSAALRAQYTALSGYSACTDLTTLIALLNNLRTQYTAHISDAKKKNVINKDPAGNVTAIRRKYHVAPTAAEYYQIYRASGSSQPNLPWIHFLNFSLLDPDLTIPSGFTIDKVLPYINDLRDKWNWHTYAPLTHYNGYRKYLSESYTGIGTHKTALARVETYTWAKVSPNYGTFIQYVKDLKTEYDAHRTSDTHFSSDTINAIDAAFPTTPANFHESVTLLGVLAHYFYRHHWDMFNPQQIFFQADSHSNTTLDGITSTTGLTTAFKLVPITSVDVAAPFTWKFDGTVFPSEKNSYTISAIASGTEITLNSNIGDSVNDREYVATNAVYHPGGPTSILFDANEYSESLAAIDYSFPTASSLTSLGSLAKDLSAAFSSHSLSGTTVVSASSSGDSVLGLDKISLNGHELDLYKYTTLASTGASPIHHFGNYTITTYGSPSGLGNSLVAYSYWPSASASAAIPQSHFTDTQPVASSINYVGLYRYDYTVGTLSFSDFGPPTDAINVISFTNQAQSNSATEKGKNSVALSSIYVLTNASNENWATGDTTNFRKEIYRTIGNGTSYYKVTYDGSNGDTTNAATTLDDYTVDSFLIDQQALYTNGGIVANDKPPLAKYIHMHDGRMYYALGNKLYQSIQDDPDSVPADFVDEFPYTITGISSTRGNVVVFTPLAIYRLEGEFNDLGQGFMRHESIPNCTGSDASQSIVKADNGVFFAGLDGFYYTDGVQCVRVTDLTDTFLAFTSTAAKRNAIQGAYNAYDKRVYWTINSNGSVTYPTTVWVLDLKFGIQKDVTPVTTFSGGFDTYTGFRPTALTVFNRELHFGDNDGYIFKQDSSTNLDVKRDTSVVATSWAKRPVLWDWKSSHMDFGTTKYRKYCTHIGSQFFQTTNLSVQISSDADKGRVENDLPIIRSRKLTNWGDTKIDWITDHKSGEIIDEKRRFKGDGSLRSNYRAIEMKNAYCVIVASDGMGLLNVTNVSTHVWALTLVNAATRKWPLYSVDYFVRISGVDYPVTVRTSDSVVRVDDTGLTALSLQSGIEWEMWGYPKNERMNLIQYNIEYDALGDTQKTYEGETSSDGGENE